MAGIALKIWYGILTILLGVFLVVPFVITAICTTTLAIWVLSLVLLFKGIGYTWYSALQWWKGDPRNSPEAIAQRERAAAHAKQMAISQSGSTSASQSSPSNTAIRSHSNRSNRSNSNVSLATLPQLDRDYEGVGGWLPESSPYTNDRAPTSNITYHTNNNSNSSQTSFTNITTRPDTTPPTFRRRSFGASSNGINSPEPLHTPSTARHSAMGALHARSAHGATSPTSYFNNGTAARSTTSVNSRRGSVMTALRGAEEFGSDDEAIPAS